MSDEEIPFLASDSQYARKSSRESNGLRAWWSDHLYPVGRTGRLVLMGLIAVPALTILLWTMCVTS